MILCHALSCQAMAWADGFKVKVCLTLHDGLNSDAARPPLPVSRGGVEKGSNWYDTLEMGMAYLIRSDAHHTFSVSHPCCHPIFPRWVCFVA